MDQFRGLFAKLDKNKDGLISMSELEDEMKKHGILLVDRKVQVTIWCFCMCSNLIYLVKH